MSITAKDSGKISLTAPGNVCFIFSLYEFACSRYLREVKSYNICPLVPALFPLA